MRTIRGMGMYALLLLVMAAPSWAGVSVGIGVSVRVGPPALPVYEQPLCPGAGYIWTPGYWAYGSEGYYWVPGTWVMAPEVGLLWTPGYWGWGGGGYAWHAGYWGPHVGFYGGINYGFGYGGVGYVGGRWDHGVFAYNTAVTRVDTRFVHTTFVDRTVIRETTVNRVSFNGGAGGLRVRASAQEEAAMHERHSFATAEQTQHEHFAAGNHQLLASVNHGRPGMAATPRPGEFGGHGGMAPHDAPHPGGNSHGVPRPPSHEARAEPTSFYGNNGMQHSSPSPHSAPHGPAAGGERHGPERHGDDQHHDGQPHETQHHESGGRNR